MVGFESVIFLIKVVPYPITSAVALSGGLFIMIGSQERGFSLISRTGIGYIGLAPHAHQPKKTNQPQNKKILHINIWGLTN
ncbi:hypothetical protein FHY73_23565 [Bacillus tropicus]|nr:hypothetical protein FHY73_23565 [Bacillus tropicus]